MNHVKVIQVSNLNVGDILEIPDMVSDDNPGKGYGLWCCYNHYPDCCGSGGICCHGSC